MNSRRKSKYPNLDPKLNLKRRRDEIETEYIHGIYDDKGNEVIRPLNHSELQWLNNFYGEFVNVDFYNNEEIKSLKHIQKIIGDIVSPTEMDKVAFDYINILISQAWDSNFLNTGKHKSACIEKNNKRNTDLFAVSKASGKLQSLTDEAFEEVHDSIYNNPEISDLILEHYTNKEMDEETISFFDRDPFRTVRD